LRETRKKKRKKFSNLTIENKNDTFPFLHRCHFGRLPLQIDALILSAFFRAQCKTMKLFRLLDWLRASALNITGWKNLLVFQPDRVTG
jgi:hypothetical protein